MGLESVGDYQLCLAQEAQHRPVSEHVRVVSTPDVNTLLKFLIRLIDSLPGNGNGPLTPTSGVGGGGIIRPPSVS